MTTKTNTGRVLSPANMARVQACAYLFQDSSAWNKITDYAANSGICIGNSAIAYTIGCLKRYKRLGLVDSYSQALDMLESEQVGDRGSILTRTLNTDNTARYIAKINRINKGDHFSLFGDHYVYDYDVCHRSYGYTLDGDYTYMDNAIMPHYTEIQEPIEKQESRSIGKVKGTLYTQWESRQAELDPAHELTVKAIHELTAESDQVDKNLRLYFKEYVDHLGVTVKARLYALIKSDISVEYLTSTMGRVDKHTSKMANFAANLHRNFPHKDCITCPQLVNLLREYVEV